jgi:galactokinase
MSKEDFVRAGKAFEKDFGAKPEGFIFSPGRLELLGNHTDHNHGSCLVAGCSLGIHAAIGKDDKVTIESEGYGTSSFSLKELAYDEKEKGSTLALTKGVLKGLADKGYKIGGFKAAINSDIFAGAGVSSSAAYELFVAETINVLYNEGKIPFLTKARVGQYAENVYFGKASGLLDQCGSSFGGVQYLDFHDPDNFRVEAMDYPDWLPHIVLVNPGSSHVGLNDLYSEMPKDMWLVAEKVFKKKFLGEVENPAKALEILSKPIDGIPDRARLRAIHFFSEDARVLTAKKVFSNKDLQGFLTLERQTEASQEKYLQNVMIPGHYEGSPLEAVNRANEINKDGSARVMGGGLVGSIICFVPDKDLAAFKKKMVSYYGAKAVVEVAIPRLGAHFLKEAC